MSPNPPIQGNAIQLTYSAESSQHFIASRNYDRSFVVVLVKPCNIHLLHQQMEDLNEPAASVRIFYHPLHPEVTILWRLPVGDLALFCFCHSHKYQYRRISLGIIYAM